MTNTSVTPAAFNFTILQGRTFNYSFTWTDGSGNPVDLTGYTAQMYCRYNLTDTTPFLQLTTSNGGIALGGTSGTITLSASTSTTSALTAGIGVYDLELISGSGIANSLLVGTITVQEMPTR
jgi:hypothetical protein